MLAYLSRYTHRVAISNSRLIAADANGVTFKVKDYRIEGPGRYTTMTLEVGAKTITIPYIYERQGNSLKMCCNLLPKKELPRTFSAGEGSRRAFLVFKRP